MDYNKYFSQFKNTNEMLNSYSVNRKSYQSKLKVSTEILNENKLEELVESSYLEYEKQKEEEKANLLFQKLNNEIRN